MSMKYEVTEYSVDHHRAKVIVQLVFSTPNGISYGPKHMIVRSAGESTADLRNHFRLGTRITVQGGNPVVSGQHFPKLHVRCIE